MNHLSLRRLGALVALATVAACSEPPPKPPPPPPPEPVEPEPPPPPPKCEAIDEGCVAKSDTGLPIPGTNLVFTAPEGWVYAKVEKASIVQKSDEGPFLVLGSHDREKVPQKLAELRETTAVEFAKLAKLEPPAKLGFLRPDNKEKIAGLDMMLWERPRTGTQGLAKRGAAEGAMLVIASSLEDRELLGVGFAPTDDDEGTAAILKALQTIRAEGGDEAGGGNDKKGDDQG